MDRNGASYSDGNMVSDRTGPESFGLIVGTSQGGHHKMMRWNHPQNYDLITQINVPYGPSWKIIPKMVNDAQNDGLFLSWDL